MLNIKNLIDSITQFYMNLINLKQHTFQLWICNPDTALFCNFNAFGGDSTDTYKFKIGFHGPTDKPNGVQKTMDRTVVGGKKTHCSLDNILIISHGSLED